MKKNRCSRCSREIDPNDFYSVVRFEKICSECMVEAVVDEAEVEIKSRKRQAPGLREAV